MKVLKCSDVGFDCRAVVRAATEEDVLRQAAEHARTVHQVTVTPELATKVRAQIREE
jgi:predicted small metal-binding protein